MTTPIRKLPEAFVETAIDDEIVVMSMASGDFFSIRGTARDVWLKIDGVRDRAALNAALAEDYGDEVDAGEVAEFLDALGAAGLTEG